MRQLNEGVLTINTSLLEVSGCTSKPEAQIAYLSYCHSWLQPSACAFLLDHTCRFLIPRFGPDVQRVHPIPDLVEFQELAGGVYLQNLSVSRRTSSLISRTQNHMTCCWENCVHLVAYRIDAQTRNLSVSGLSTCASQAVEGVGGLSLRDWLSILINSLNRTLPTESNVKRRAYESSSRSALERVLL